MSGKNKRKSSESGNIITKKSKYDLEKYDKLLDGEELSKRIKFDLEEMSSATDDVTEAFQYLKGIFSESFEPLPSIIFHHQLYSLVKNRTQVDREIEMLKAKNQIHVFKSESNKTYNEDDISICFTDEFNSYVQKVIIDVESINKLTNNYDTARLKNLILKFLNEILKEVKELSVSQSDLKTKFKLNESEITVLIQTGLLTIKDMTSYWFAIPFIGKFRRILLESRKGIVNILRKKRFNELFIEELYKRNIRNVNQIGIMYLMCDLIGKETVTRVDSPMGFVIKLS